MFNLVIPDAELVDRYNRLWNGEETDTMFVIFDGKGPVNITGYLPKNFASYKQKDGVIEKCYEKGDIKAFFENINSTYHTRLSSDNINSISSIEKSWFTSNGVDELVMLCKDRINVNAYSFSTKVFSFIYPNKFPIMDSMVSTLLWYYMGEDYKIEKRRKSVWGNYNEYCRAYKMFMDSTDSLKQKTFKQMDIFMWTYANVISDYWSEWCKEEGIISFSPIAYK